MSWTKILLSAAPYLIGAGAVLWVSWEIYDTGKATGYANGIEDSQEIVDQVVANANAAIEARDQEWDQAVQEYMSRILEQEQQRQLDLTRERELRVRIRGLSDRLLEIQANEQTTNLGTCNLTADFDRVLYASYSLTGR